MAKWTTPADITSRWVGAYAPDTTSAVLLTFIDDAEDEILRVFPRIQERIDANTLPLNRVKRVVAGVVIRAWKVAQEYRNSFSENTGPFAQSGSFSENIPRVIKLTEDEINTLSPESTKKVFTVSMAPFAHSNNTIIGGYLND